MPKKITKISDSQYIVEETIKLKSKIRDYQSGYCGGDVPCEICQRPDNYPYWRTFDQNGWFRGDDEVRGNLCHTCYAKARLVFKLNKQLTRDFRNIEAEFQNEQCGDR